MSAGFSKSRLSGRRWSNSGKGRCGGEVLEVFGKQNDNIVLEFALF